ncbi:MAG TPA: nicotinamide riboside transporter PnuC [Cyclobacteriaceae bacterium]|nr:nicotinamide riboside transporter PnuC [Cyclobacteriaceae bacterium]
MPLQQWFDSVIREASQIEIVQWVILILGISEVLLAKANNIYLYPAGIAATMLSVFVLFKAQLFAESLLNVYYIIMSIYGWWFWIKKKNVPPVKITHAGTFDWIITGLIGLGGWLVLFVILKEFTPSTVPAWDAWVSSTAWAGMWLLARRKVENWILLNVSNAFAIPLLFQKELPLFGLLTLFLFIVACFGYLDWIKIAKKEITHI